MDPAPVEIRRVGFDHADAVRLVAEVQAEYTRRYGGPDDTPLDPGVFDEPHGRFFVLYRGADPVAMGGWRHRPDVAAFGRSFVCEVKRMYVAPRARRSGLARRVLEHLEVTASSAGAGAMVLETGIEQPEALALYRAAGYTPVEPFGHYAWSPKSRYLGKPL
jgi:GNAT superfamily N-acetyltransferase